MNADTLIDVLNERAERDAGREALVTKAGLRLKRWSYRDLWQSSHSAARFFQQECGVRPGDRVLVMAPSSPETLTCFFGGWLTGAVLVPLDPFSTPDFVARVADQVEPTAIVTHCGSDQAPEARPIALGRIPFGARVPEVADRPAGNDIAEIVFTSGTTGAPKGVVLTHGNIVADVLALGSVVPEREDWRLLSVLPFSHMFEQTVGHFTTLEKRGTIFYPSSLSSTEVVKALRRHRIVSIVAVPALITHLLRSIEREIRRRGSWSRWEHTHQLAAHLPFGARRRLFYGVHRRLGGSLRFLISGGGKLDVSVAQTWERMGIRVIEGYGVTECAPVISCDRFDRQIPGSVGRPLPGIRVRLSVEGEVQVRGANVMQGYWRNPDATRSSFTEDGWYQTGDLAAMDEAGCLYIKGRLKEMIVLPNGLNVFPEDIEAVLARQETVGACVVLDVAYGPDDIRLTALIVPKSPTVDALTARDQAMAAVKAANANLAPYQRISDVHVWPTGDFPRTPLGKVKRFAVRAALEIEDMAVAEAQDRVGDSDLERLTRILGDVGRVPRERIAESSNLDLDLGLDSLGRVELAVALNEEFGVNVDDGEISETRTVGELIDLIHRGPPTDTPVPFPDWALAEPARSARELLQFGFLLPMHALIARPFKVLGRDTLEKQDLPVLFVSNHCSHMDTLAIIRALPHRIRRRTTIAAAADYFYSSRQRGAAASVILNTFPFSREGAVRAALEHCGELIDEGWSVLVYPEGTRSTTGELLPFKRGAGYLARELNVPIVPIAVHGGFEMLPKGRALPRPGPMTVQFGRPLEAPSKGDPDAVARRLREVVATLKRAVDGPYEENRQCNE